MAKSDHAWVTLTRIHVRSAEYFAEEASFWDRVSLNFEPGDVAEWDLATTGAISWKGMFEVRGDDEDDLEKGHHAINPRNAFIDVNATAAVDLSKVVPPEVKLAGFEDDNFPNTSDPLPPAAVDLKSIARGGRASAGVTQGDYRYDFEVIVQPDEVAALSVAADLPGGSSAEKDPAIAWSATGYPVTRPYEALRWGDGGRWELHVAWQEHPEPPSTLDQDVVRVFNAPHRQLRRFGRAAGGVAMGRSDGDPDEAIVAYRNNGSVNQITLVTLRQDGSTAESSADFPASTALGGIAMVSRPCIAPYPKGLALAYADRSAGLIRVFLFDQGLTAFGGGTVLPEPITIVDTTELAPALAFFDGRLWLAWSAGGSVSVPGKLRLRDLGPDGTGTQEWDLGADAPHAPALAALAGQYLVAAWTDASGLVTVRDVTGGALGSGVTVNPLSISGPALATTRSMTMGPGYDELYVAWATLDRPHVMNYERVMTAGRGTSITATATVIK